MLMSILVFLYTVPKVTKIPKAKRKKEEDDEKLQGRLRIEVLNYI